MIHRLACLMTLIVVSIGCSGGQDSSPRQATTQTDAQSEQQPPHPAIAVTKQFLAAVIQGDVEGATTQLTPAAIEQFQTTGRRFAPPGFAGATFSLGEVRAFDNDEVGVACTLSDGQSGSEAQHEEMICVLRKVAAGWRVAGILYEGGPNETIAIDFENLEQSQVIRHDQQDAPPADEVVDAAATPPHSARTAAQPSANTAR